MQMLIGRLLTSAGEHLGRLSDRFRPAFGRNIVSAGVSERWAVLVLLPPINDKRSARYRFFIPGQFGCSGYGFQGNQRVAAVAGPAFERA